MITESLALSDHAPQSDSPTSSVRNLWYVAHTRANHEKRAHEQLLQRSIDSFLPTYLSVRRWKDRRVRLQVPLFPGYLFVRIPLQERLRVLEIPSVARLVGFNGLPAPIEDNDISSLQRASSEGTARPHPYLTVGRRVRVIAGPLLGAEGILIKRKGNFRVILSVGLIRQSVTVEVGEGDLEALSCPPREYQNELATAEA